jgi:hypothetical protein
MKGGLNKEKAEWFSQLERNRQKIVVEHNEEEEGIKMETKSENETRKNIFPMGLG